jgi:hypothetical protein
MTKIDYEIKECLITKKVPVDAHLICDACGKEVENKNNYWYLSTGHYDWGNDSCESVETFHLCSDECLKNKINEYLDDVKCYDTPHFEVEKHRWFKESCVG